MIIIEKLSKRHNKNKFDCGQEDINTFLKVQSNQSAKKNYSKTYVIVEENNFSEIIAFYSLAICKLDKPSHHIINKKYPYDMFGLSLARMGVDKKYQKQRYSEVIIIDAIKKTCSLSSIAGMQGLYVDPKSKKLINFYRKYNFELINENDDENIKMWITIKTCECLFRN